MILEQINKDNLLIICPNDYKNKILEFFSANKKIANVKFTTLEEYKKNYLFDYDIKTIKYLVDQGLSVNNAKEIIENLYYIENKTYNNKKLDKLVNYKKDLDSKELLIYNGLYKNYVETKNVVVLGYGKLNSYDLSIIKGKTVECLEYKETNKNYVINTFENIEEEVQFVYNSIYDLLEKGIDINKIYIMNAKSDYNAYFKRFNEYYGFNVETDNGVKLSGTKISEEFINMLENSTKEEIYDYLVNKNNEIAHELIDILNKYTDFELNEVKQLIVNDVKNSFYKKEYKNIVRNIKIMSCIDDNDYVFFVGLNDSTPSMKKDISYITDNIKSLINIPTTEEINELRKNNLKSYLSGIKNLVLSYSKNSPFNTYNKQIILKDNVCEYKAIQNSNIYSDELNKAIFTKDLDKLRKYNIKQKDIDKFYNTYNKNDYLSYNNRFKGLSEKQISEITKQINSKNNGKLILSYSSMNGYFECNFKYYLDTVLKIKEPFGNYYTKLGTVCHGVLEELYNDQEFDFDKAWNRQIKKEEEKGNVFECESDKYFINKIKEELKQDIEIMQKQKANSQLNNVKCENNFTVNVTEKISFTGFVDKIMYKEADNEILASVIDYKTNKSIEIDKDIMKYGLSLQLPSYLYLIKHSKKFNKEIRFAGLYIQHLINFDRKYRSEKSSLDDNKEESMRLDGISTNLVDRIIAADLTLETSNKSTNIKNISINKDGSLKKSNKLYSDEQFDELDEIVENSIIKAGEAILKGDFAINPKEIDEENKSCKYCKYAPICYKRASDLVYLSTAEEE